MRQFELDTLGDGDYKLISCFCRTDNRHVGTAIFTRNLALCNKYHFEINCELSRIMIDFLTIIVLLLSPNGSFAWLLK